MLKDVCNAPMVNDFTGPRVVEQCLVQSLFGYFSNNWDKFYQEEETETNITINYLDQLETCIR
jgi:Niemann-Pick C1 protein